MPTRSDALTRPVRVAIILATLLCSAVLARTIYIHKMSEAFFEQPNLPLAYGINPSDGMIAGYLSSTLQSVGNDKAAETLARKAIANTPLSARAIATAALTQENDNPKLSQYLLTYAANLGWRDERIQIRLARAALDRGDVDDAATRVDAAANLEGAHGDVRTLIDDMAKSGPSLRAITKRFALNPSWRGDYLISVDPPMGSLDARAKILGELTSANMPVSDVEKAAIILLFTKTGGLSSGHDVWLTLDKPDLAHFVFDPQFKLTHDDSTLAPPFVWGVHTPPGVSTDTDSDNGQNALHVTSDGTAVGAIAGQLIKIPPGHHVLTTSARYSTPGAASGFRWALICWNETAPTAPVSPLSGTAVGNAHFDFNIPSDGTCPFQQLILQAQAAEQPDQIEAWFNDVRVD